MINRFVLALCVLLAVAPLCAIQAKTDQLPVNRPLMDDPLRGHSKPVVADGGALDPFAFVPYSDSAFKALGVLQDASLVSGYDFELHRAGVNARATTGTLSGNGELTPYEFGIAITEAYPLPLVAAKFPSSPVADAARRSRADALLDKNPEAIAAMQLLTNEFRPILVKLGEDVLTLNARLAALTEESDKPFPDVPLTHWAYQSVETLRKAGIVIGYPDNHFRAN